VCSAVALAGAERRDGISYLQQQKRRGLVTPLISPYEEAVLKSTGARDLDGAWERARGGQSSPELPRTRRSGLTSRRASRFRPTCDLLMAVLHVIEGARLAARTVGPDRPCRGTVTESYGQLPHFRE
jgi:hypothetical protein